jgi:hypothetical protein
MQFEVLAGESLEITDPETGQPLGALDRAKVRVEVTDIHDKFSICETFGLVEVPGTMISAADFFRPSRTVQATFNARERPRPLSQEESIVQIGDRVKQVTARRVPQSRVVSG